MKRNLLTTVATAVASAVVIISATPITSFAIERITLDQAKKIALDNAGLKADEVTIVKEGYEAENGRAEYEIEFFKGNAEYDYEIDAQTGKINSFDQEIETKYTKPAANDSAVKKISEDKALEIALDHAGYKKDDTLYTQVKKDFEDGQEVYEVEFRVGFVEYNYNISVTNGQIVDFEIDD